MRKITIDADKWIKDMKESIKLINLTMQKAAMLF